MAKKTRLLLFFRILFIIGTSFASFYFMEKKFYFSGIIIGVFALIQILVLINSIQKLFFFYEVAIDSILHKDFNTTYPSDTSKGDLYNKTIRLMDSLRQEDTQVHSEKNLFSDLIEELGIGILILKRNRDTNEISVFQMNKAFSNFLKIPKLFNWKLLENRIAPVLEVINFEKWQNSNETVSIKTSTKKESFFLKTAVTKGQKMEYMMLTLETVEQLIEKKEKESWFKLMQVMSHEIINTITPISSLAENLGGLIEEEEDIEKEDLSELKEGLGIIKNRSKHLSSFVDGYRKLTQLPTPIKQRLDLGVLTKGTLALFSKSLEEKGIQLETQIEESIWILADRNMLEQAMINLLSNAIYAVENVPNPILKVRLDKQENRHVLSLIDNGFGIEDELKDSIFIPYFTTRKNGMGIGLTLTKTIIEAHDGFVDYTSENGNTAFNLRLPFN